ncbi:hypothetical protein OAC97_00160 [Flavobacteriaceae bacterium]|nr:hypothetical protein [Flavobacteriaceae bacterium]
MNISKNIFLILFSLLSTISFAQNTSELDCENDFEIIETEILSQEKVSYKILYSQKTYTKESFEFSKGVLVIADLNNQLTIKEIINIIGRIAVKNKLSEVLAFRTCKAVELYYQNEKLTLEQTDYLQENLLPSMEIDLNKSLSKKERKKNKKKRDLIEKVSKESCGELEGLKTDNLTMEQLNQVVSSVSSQYAEKTMKVYEMSFEESVDLFLKDLINHLLYDCELMKKTAMDFNGKSE